ncbi:N6-adenosine-methyltransferase IME4 [Wickerhamomyces ciferrii]|uniref:mRNA m(6)A methyltransferase n=1 Tax=Wickerhamomyces ciferrii (strain ATCC 14091 / BCRC 22168 / CBS 111 / JCM 3599 / NBRC 0793 / NRRL Y-1031 F-60-10) TaxID=1206466 RepID=K0KIL4_WICCF|nr:N6-adenosine-methyltransferase IME4 [Wickerhamomyces ciferrii]CCH42022.1 N6-adenosine-methyltransferase IME4 [Wickerhamomyces ciferrii]
MIDFQLISFLKDHHRLLINQPINGCIYTIFTLFKNQYNGGIEYEEFIKKLNLLIKIDPFIIQFRSNTNQEEIEFINTLNLDILLQKLNNSNEISNPIIKKESSTSQLDQLQDLLKPNNNPDLIKLYSLINYTSTSTKLSKEKLKFTTPKYPFIEICNNQQHIHLTKTNTQCFQTKIHFIPLIKNHTDASLGDCSYLDTCHKMDTCRYIHYQKHIPQEYLNSVEQKCNEFNSTIIKNQKTSFWNINGSTATISRPVLPPQWINCDVRKFDFSILGKFAVVIADPAWNIHMNLPYGTCNDTELNSLPLSSIQDEGIICLWVTGRTIEIGKKALVNWGYKVSNEIIWIKTNQLGRTICTGRTGHWLNHSKEHLIIGIKGSPNWLNKNLETDILVSGTRETSRKPDELYGMMERLVGPHARKLEIFGRDHNTRFGWFTIGNQLKGNQIVEHDVLKRYETSKMRG